MLSRFGVKNYKSLVDVDIPLSKIHVLIGQNDSGKTSVLEAIHAFCRSAQAGMPLQQAFEGRWEGRDLVHIPAEQPEVVLSSRIKSVGEGENTVNGYGFTVLFQPTADRACSKKEEWYIDRNDLRVNLPLQNQHYTCLAQRYQVTNQGNLGELLNVIADTISNVVFCRLEPKMMAVPASIDEKRKFRMDPDGFGLSTVLDDILGHNAERFIQLSNEFCEFFPEFRRVRIQTEMASQRSYEVTGLHGSGRATGKGIYFELRGGEAIRAQQASDGAVLFLGFLALFYLPTPPRILLIEEPEKGIYPKRLEEIIGLLKRVVVARGDCEAPQIIFTTHSPYVLSQFTPDEVTLMSRRDGYVIARPLRDAPHIMERLAGGEFYLGELWYNLDEEELFQDVDSESRH